MSIIEELENSIDIVELVSKYTHVKKAWVNYKWLCPFPGHSEKTPSFMVSPSKQIAYCFWCHRWWWAIKFVMDIENCEFRDAVEILWWITWKSVEWFYKKTDDEIKVQKNIYSLYKDATNYYKSSIKKYPEILEYVKNRWLNSESIELFSLWYSDNWLWLYNYLKEKWYSDDSINESQIFLDIWKRKDKFIWRLIFPVKNNRWDIVAFAWRIINSWEPKYLNSPASKIYDKSNILYWLFEARQEITKKDFIIITEWYLDTIALHQAWFKNTVCVSWTALTEKHLHLIKRLTNKIYLCFDNDKAWENATKLSLELLKNSWFEIKIILLEWWKDPDEVIKSWADFWDFIKKAVSPIIFYIKKSEFDRNSFDDKKIILKTILELLKDYTDNIEKDFYIKEISIFLDIPTKIIYEELNKIPKNRESINKIENRTITWEDLSIAYIVVNKDYKEIINKWLIFNENLNNDLKDALNNDNFLEKLPLEKKEFFRWIALELEEKLWWLTENKIKDDIIKLIYETNRSIYEKEKKYINEVLEKDKNNTEILVKYTSLIKKAREAKII